MELIELNEFYPLVKVEGNVALTNDGDTFLCYALKLPEIFTQSKGDYTSIHDRWFNAFKKLPGGTIIHKQDICLKDDFKGEGLPNLTFLQKATKSHFVGRQILNHYSLLFIGKTTASYLKRSDLFNPLKKSPKLSQLRQEALLDNEFIDEVEKTVEYINDGKTIEIIPLSEDDIHGYVKNFFNGFNSDKNVDTTLNAKIKTKAKEYNVIGVGDKRVGIYSINNTKQLPDYADIFKIDGDYSSKKFEIYKGSGDDFGVRLPYNHIYNQIIFLTDQRKLKEDLENKRRNLDGAKGFSKENESAANQVGEYLDELSNDEQRIVVNGHTNIIFYADDNAEFEKANARVSTLFKNLDYTPSYPNSHLIKDTYIKSLFAYSPRMTAIQCYQTELSIALTTYLNTTAYRNDDDGILFTDRVFNVPVVRDVRDALKKRIKAWNFMVFAPTGEGKSVLVQHVFRQFNELGYKLVIFDIGGSFHKMSYLIDPEKSQFISYEPGQPLGINPFDLSDNNLPTVEEIQQVAEFVFQLWKPKEEYTQEYETPLVKLVSFYFKNINSVGNFPHFYSFILANKSNLLESMNIESRFFDIEDFLFYCSSYVGDGQYSFLFKETADISSQVADKDIVVFEFDKAQDDEIVLSVLMNIASHTVRSVIWEDKSKEGVIFFDEAAKFFKNKAILDTVIFYYQAIRKQTGSVGTALQSPTQFPQTPEVDAMCENTQVLYILNNKQGYQPIVDRFQLSDHQHNILKSITPNLSGKNPYTEFALIIGSEIWVMRLELPKEAFLAYMTDGKEHERLMADFRKKELSMGRREAMEAAIKEFQY